MFSVLKDKGATDLPLQTRRKRSFLSHALCMLTQLCPSEQSERQININFRREDSGLLAHLSYCSTALSNELHVTFTLILQLQMFKAPLLAQGTTNQPSCFTRFQPCHKHAHCFCDCMQDNLSYTLTKYSY